MGTVYKRGNTYWIKYYCNGKPYFESSGSKKDADSKRLLKKREGEISNGKTPGVYFDRVRFDELAEGFLRDYRINQKKSLKRAEQSTEYLKKYFEGSRIIEASRKQEVYLESRTGTIGGTIVEIKEKRANQYVG